MLLTDNKMWEIQSNNNEVQKGQIDVNSQKIDINKVFAESSTQSPQNNNSSGSLWWKSSWWNPSPISTPVQITGWKSSWWNSTPIGNQTSAEVPGWENSWWNSTPGWNVSDRDPMSVLGWEDDWWDSAPVENATSVESLTPVENSTPTEAPGWEDDWWNSIPGWNVSDRDPMSTLGWEDDWWNPILSSGWSDVENQPSVEVLWWKSNWWNSIPAENPTSAEKTIQDAQAIGWEDDWWNPIPAEIFGNQKVELENEWLQINNNSDIKNDAELKKEKDVADMIIGIWAIKNPIVINDIIKEIPVLTGSLADEFLKAIEGKLDSKDTLFFDNLEFVDLEAAKKLAETRYFLSFENSRFLSSERMEKNALSVLDELMKHKTWLSLWLEKINIDIAQKLWSYQWIKLILDKVDSMKSEAAAQLVQMMDKDKDLIIRLPEDVDHNTILELAKYADKWSLSLEKSDSI